MTVFKNENRWDTSNVVYKDGKILIYDKVNCTATMKYVDYGLGIFHKAAFDHVPDKSVFDLATLYQNLLREKQLAAFEVTERFYEIGSLAGLEEIKPILKRTSDLTT
jgi:NDP-sugar pyrophosphorylase family protein